MQAIDNLPTRDDIGDKAFLDELRRRALKSPDFLSKSQIALAKCYTRPKIKKVIDTSGNETASDSDNDEVINEEIVAKNPRLTPYYDQYNSLYYLYGKRMTFKKFADKLLANGGEKLKLAESMQGGGNLFHINPEGEALFRDKGSDPVMYGFDQDDKLIEIYDRDPDDMAKVKKWANYYEIRKKVLEDGYEMFPFKDERLLGFSDYMRYASEVNKERRFIDSRDGQIKFESWLESGKNPDHAISACSAEHDIKESLSIKDKNFLNRRYKNIGVVRLLRV